MNQSPHAQVNLALTLQSGKTKEAAQHCLQLMSETEWRLMVSFALEVVCLQEAVSQEVRHLILPTDSELFRGEP